MASHAHSVLARGLGKRERPLLALRMVGNVSRTADSPPEIALPLVPGTGC